MKKIMYGTVSALALVLAATGAKADGDGNLAAALSATDNSVSRNVSAFGLIAGDNEIDQNAFGQAAGAFNVGQNQSVNSTVQQSMAIGAVINKVDASQVTKGDDQIALAISVGSSSVSRNVAVFQDLDSHNEIENNAFGQARGAFNVLQNESVNSGVSQGMAIGAVVSHDPGQDKAFENAGLAASALSSTTTGNLAIATDLGGGHFTNTNSLTNNAFGQARGAFNVLQNASINSSVQQSMAIGAVVNK